MATETIYLPTKKVLQRYGVSAMTLWRWEHDTAQPFPAPLIINRRKFYELPAIETWERARAAAATATMKATAIDLADAGDGRDERLALVK